MKQVQKKGSKNIIGAYGEEVTCEYLKTQGFTILETNYLKKWGEIDVIAHQGSIIHFVEVKTVSYETKEALDAAIESGDYAPEVHVDERKLQKLARAVETWVAEKRYIGEYQLDVMAVRVVPSERYATVKYLTQVIRE